MTTIKALPDGNIGIHVTCAFKRLSGRMKLVAEESSLDNGSAIVLAIARARRWTEMLESGDYSSGVELAKALGVDSSYLRRIMRLKYLSPAIIGKLLDGNLPGTISLERLQKLTSDIWAEQHSALGLN